MSRVRALREERKRLRKQRAFGKKAIRVHEAAAAPNADEAAEEQEEAALGEEHDVAMEAQQDPCKPSDRSECRSDPND